MRTKFRLLMAALLALPLALTACEGMGGFDDELVEDEVGVVD